MMLSVPPPSPPHASSSVELQSRVHHRTSGDVTTTIVAATRVKQFFTIGGMTCSACSGTIERALQSLPSVHSASISLLTARCEVVYDSSLTNEKRIIGEIEDVGFDAAVSVTLSKGTISLLTSEHMSNDKRVLITKALMDHTGVLSIHIKSRLTTPFHDVITVEYDAVQHELCGPGGAMPIVWQGDPKMAPTAAVASSSSSPSSSSPSSSPADSLGRFSIRAVVNSLKLYSCTIVSVSNDGDMESRKMEMKLRHIDEMATWRRALLQSLMFTVPISAICWISPLFPLLHASLMSPIHHALTYQSVILCLLVTPVQFWVGARFYRNAYKALKHGAANMDVLVALGSSASYFYSLIICAMCAANEHYKGNVFFETSALLISIVLLGRYVENMAKGRTSDALSVLMSLQSPTATLLTIDPTTGASTSEDIDVNLVQRDDVLLVHRGAQIPVDGVIIDGHTSVDEALLTGESMPVTKTIGSTIIGGTLNLDQPIRMRVTGVGADSTLFKIVNMVDAAQSSKAPIQAYADYIGSIFVPTVVALSVMVFLIWYALCVTGVVPEDWMGEHENSFLFAFLFGVSVLLISCPCSLGLATPTAVMVGTGVGASLGVLFKGGEPLERTGAATVVVFDKTGTLTAGRPSVSAVDTWITGLSEEMNEKEWWSLVGAVAQMSEHLMSRAIATYARDQVIGTRGITSFLASPVSIATASVSPNPPSPSALLDPVTSFEALSGGGCGGTVRSRSILIGNARWMLQHGVTITDECNRRMDSAQTRGNIAVMVAMDGTITAVVSLVDAIKPEARLTVRSLQTRGIDVYMLTGDNERSARAVGEIIGISGDFVIAQVTPGDKADVIKQIQKTGKWTKEDREREEEEEDEHEGSEMKNIKIDKAVYTSVSSSTASSSSTSIPSSSPPSIRSLASLATSPIVLFVGDGINDSIGLAQADVGIAIGSGTDIALETAQVVLMKSDLTDVITAIDLSQATMNRIRRNFTWACIYNLLSIPIAAGCFYPIVHVGLPPIVAAACMGLSSISVIASSLLLKRYRKPILFDVDADFAQGRQGRQRRLTSQNGFSSIPDDHDEEEGEEDEVIWELA